MITCPQCHNQNHPTATQCYHCGFAPLSAAQAGVPVGFASTNAPGFALGTGTGGTGGGPGVPSMSGAAAQPQIGSLIDKKYQVERILGEGGMGVVYVALDINADQRVVIKAIRPEFANRGDFRERTLSEGKALAKIDHQNVVRFNSIINSVETGELYIVMQYIDGESLDRTLEKANAASQHLPVPEVIRLFKQVLDGVGAAHKEGLVHRDLKPANILVRAKDGIAKVMDFGISKAEGATKGPTQAGGIVGSLYYMAPEQIKGARDLDKRLDIYALGVVLYELITGFVPFDAETEYEIMTKHMSEPLPSVRLRRPDAPPWIDDVIQHATQKERAARFQSCEEFRTTVDGFDGGIAVPRSSTSNDVPAAYTSGAVPRAASGTAVMSSPMMGTPGMGPPMGGPPIGVPPSPVYDDRQRGGGGSSAIWVVLALVLVGGGGTAAWYFTAGPGGSGATKTAAKEDKKDDDKADKPSKKDDDKPAKKDDEKVVKKDDDKPAKKDDDKKDDKKDDEKKDPPPAAKKKPAEALVGNWKADGSGRTLEATISGDDVEFKVKVPSEWADVYQVDEVRFIAHPDGDGFLVTDRVRIAPPGKTKYAGKALALCTREVNDVKGTKLSATLKGADTLEVLLSAMDIDKSGFRCSGGDGQCDGSSTEVASCENKLYKLDTLRTVTAKLRKVK